jgi:hypothetical protein
MASDEWQQEELPLLTNPPPSENVLGDSLQSRPLSHRDALGRGCKGQAHGSIGYKTTTQARKSGKVKTYQQAWYQWQDATGKRCCYLNQKEVAEIRRMLDEGAIVADILAYLDQSLPKTISEPHDQLIFSPSAD